MVLLATKALNKGHWLLVMGMYVALEVAIKVTVVMGGNMVVGGVPDGFGVLWEWSYGGRNGSLFLCLSCFPWSTKREMLESFRISV